jgi:hypothetical protein
MIATSRATPVLFAALLLLAACAPGGGLPVTEPQLGSGPKCYTSPDPAQCRMAHHLAGGYPMQHHTADR